MIDNQPTTNGSANLAMAMTCPKCGAENTDEARFCRICGVQLGAEGFHEAPTRSFEQGKTPSPAQEVSPFATYGADGSAILPPRDPRMYVPPSVVQPPGAMMGYQHGTAPAGPIPTNPLQTGPVRKSYAGRIFAVIAGLVVFVLVALIGLGVWIASNVTPTVRDDGKGGVEVSMPGGAPIVTINEGTSPDSLKGPIAEWYYDGATIETHINGGVAGASGSVLKMNTEDDVETVAEFYREKFAESRNSQEIRKDDKVVFEGDGINVVIMPSDEKRDVTDVVVVMGRVGGDGNGGGPTVIVTPGGGIPVPPAPPEAPKADGTAKPDATAPKAEATAPPAKPAKP